MVLLYYNDSVHPLMLKPLKSWLLCLEKGKFKLLASERLALQLINPENQSGERWNKANKASWQGTQL